MRRRHANVQHYCAAALPVNEQQHGQDTVAPAHASMAVCKDPRRKLRFTCANY